MPYLTFREISIGWSGSRLSFSSFSGAGVNASFRLTLAEGEPLSYNLLPGDIDGLPKVEFENIIQVNVRFSDISDYLDNTDFEGGGTRTVALGQIDWGEGLSTAVIVVHITDGFTHQEFTIGIAGSALPFLSSLNWDDFYNSITYRGPLKDFEFASGEPIPVEMMSLAEVVPISGVETSGTEESEEINGGIAADEISGGEGNDTISGFQGSDRLSGDGGDDVVDGGSGNDTLLGGEGNDTLNGGDGSDTLNGGDGDDEINGGATDADLRDVIYAGAGNDTIDAGHGNDLVYGQNGNDTIAGGFGVDELQGQDGDDVITGSAFSDLVFGGAGDDFVNGGFGSDRINGGTGADKFFHVGVAGHGSDWVQDYVAADGDVLLWGGGPATADDFQVNFAHTANDAGERAGDDAVQEAFVIYKPTGQIIWALVDGEGQSSINLQIGGDTFDLLT